MRPMVEVLAWLLAITVLCALCDAQSDQDYGRTSLAGKSEAYFSTPGDHPQTQDWRSGAEDPRYQLMLTTLVTSTFDRDPWSTR